MSNKHDNEWHYIEEKKPTEGQEVEFPADKKRDGIIQGEFLDGFFWSSFDGFHDPQFWRLYQKEKE